MRAVEGQGCRGPHGGELDLDLRLWGKSRGLAGRRYPLTCHLLDTAATAGALWADFVPDGLRAVVAAGLGTTEDHAGRLIVLWAGLHDIGKITPDFQQRDPGADLDGYPPSLGHKPRHDHAGHEWLRTGLPCAGYTDTEGAMVAALLGGHHGRFYREPSQACRPSLSQFGFADDAWERQRQATLRLLSEIAGQPDPPAGVGIPAAMLVCAIVILADWLVSQDWYLRERLGELSPAGTLESLSAHFGRAKQLAPVVAERAGLRQLRLRAASFTETFPFIAEPNDLQLSIASQLPGLVTGPGLLVVMAPPGSGKTETALHAAKIMGDAAGRPGLYVALPTMATADQMYSRVADHARNRAEVPGPLTLLHSMAWLSTSAGGPGSTGDGQAADPAILTGDDHVRPDQFAATDWLRGHRRGLLSSWAVGTIDQALMAVLRARYNMLRMAGLAGKTVVVDEVHACDPYMQGLLRQLLRWLGAFGTPVVLLSATLTQRAARQLIAAYLEGTGRPNRRRAAALTAGAAITYPGWVYADGGTGEITTRSATLPARTLRAELREVQPGPGGAPARAGALRTELDPLAASGGSALVICTTVAEAQQAYLELRGWFTSIAEAGGSPPDLGLLHARFPAWQRAHITGQVIERFGKNGHRGARPRAAVLVATQIVEQSLDLDFDLIISDLAPVALLLQRAGRCWRHDDLGVITRPRWADGPRLVVLVPPGGPASPLLARSWQAVYHESLLRATHRLLAEWGNSPIRIPADVQDLVDRVYEDPRLNTGIEDALADRIGDEITLGQMSRLVAIPQPKDTGALHELTDGDLDDEHLIATRFGADSVRVLPVFADDAGNTWLDPARQIPLPGSDGDRPGGNQIRTIMMHTLPVRGGAWLADPGAACRPPATWQHNARLRHLLLLRHRLGPDGAIYPAQVGGRELLLDPELGLVHLNAPAGRPAPAPRAPSSLPGTT